MMSGKRWSRRALLKSASAAVAAPLVFTSALRGANAPSNRINIGVIGTGRMGSGDMMEVMGFGDVSIIAVCDVDRRRAALAKQRVETFYATRSAAGAYKGCTAYGDFRELVARPDIDAVMICTPEHWHALAGMAAARAGKDIFVQKPLTMSLVEGRVLSDTVRRYGRILQVGSQQRSDTRFRFACELARNQYIGKLHTVKVGLPMDPGTTPKKAMPVPPELDYDFWLGPCRYEPYTEERVHPQKSFDRPGWLRIHDYCLGMITGWGSHHNDIAQWGMGTEHTGPVEITATAQFPKDGLWDVHLSHRIEYTYANGVKVLCTDSNQNKAGVTFEGTEGWVYVDRGRIDANPKSLLTATIQPNETHLYESRHHKGNWIECMKSRRPTICPVEVGHRSNSVCILGDIAMRLRRKLRWDPQRELFVGDEEANRLLSRPYREPWAL